MLKKGDSRSLPVTQLAISLVLVWFCVAWCALLVHPRRGTTNIYTRCAQAQGGRKSPPVFGEGWGKIRPSVGPLGAPALRRRSRLLSRWRRAASSDLCADSMAGDITPY